MSMQTAYCAECLHRCEDLRGVMNIHSDEYFRLNGLLTKGGRRSPAVIQKMHETMNGLVDKYGASEVNYALSRCREPGQCQTNFGYVKGILRNRAAAQRAETKPDADAEAIRKAVEAKFQ